MSTRSPSATLSQLWVSTHNRCAQVDWQSCLATTCCQSWTCPNSRNMLRMLRECCESPHQGAQVYVAGDWQQIYSMLWETCCQSVVSDLRPPLGLKYPFFSALDTPFLPPFYPPSPRVCPFFYSVLEAQGLPLLDCLFLGNPRALSHLFT